MPSPRGRATDGPWAHGRGCGRDDRLLPARPSGTRCRSGRRDGQRLRADRGRWTGACVLGPVDPVAGTRGEAGVLKSRGTVVGLILAATALFVVGILLEHDAEGDEHASASVAYAAETGAESAEESGGEES